MLKDKKITLQNELDYLKSRDLQGPVKRIDRRIELATKKLGDLEDSKVQLQASEGEAREKCDDATERFEEAKAAVVAIDADVKEIIKKKAGYTETFRIPPWPQCTNV